MRRLDSAFLLFAAFALLANIIVTRESSSGLLPPLANGATMTIIKVLGFQGWAAIEFLGFSAMAFLWVWVSRQLPKFDAVFYASVAAVAFVPSLESNLAVIWQTHSAVLAMFGAIL